MESRRVTQKRVVLNASASPTSAFVLMDVSGYVARSSIGGSAEGISPPVDPLSEQAANDPMTIIDNMYVESCLMMVEGYLGLFQVNGSAVTLFPFVDSGFHFQCLHIISCRFVWLGNVQRNRMGIAFLGIQLFTCIL